MKFAYYQIRPCVEHDGETHSFFTGDNGDGNPTPGDSFNSALLFCREKGLTHRDVFWTLYGYDGPRAVAIGDFVSFDAAYEVMNGILAPLGDVWRTAEDVNGSERMTAEALTKLSCMAMDICNQSTNDERL